MLRSYFKRYRMGSQKKQRCPKREVLLHCSQHGLLQLLLPLMMLAPLAIVPLVGFPKIYTMRQKICLLTSVPKVVCWLKWSYDKKNVVGIFEIMTGTARPRRKGRHWPIWVEIIAITTKKSELISDLFIREWLRRYPRPSRVIFDSGGEFDCEAFHTTCLL